MNLYTIGFTQKTAQQFFDLLKSHGVERLIDIRLRPDGQLAGFTKQGDLRYFLQQLIGCDYVHLDLLTPTDEMLKGYRADKDWAAYESAFQSLLDQRGVPAALDRALFESKTCCLLYSEPAPERCHRRLVAERLARAWEDITAVHL